MTLKINFLVLLLVTAVHPVIAAIIDDRVPSVDPRIGRITTLDGADPFCTGWLLSNGVFATAGHCVTKDGVEIKETKNCSAVLDEDFQAIEFNVPPSDANGETRPSDEKDRYPIDTELVWCQHVDFAQYTKDWALFAVRIRESQLPVEKRGFFRPVDLADFPTKQKSSVRLTGFGEAEKKINQTQQTAAGLFLGTFPDSSLPWDPDFSFLNLWYEVFDDTGGGSSSGSPVYLNGTSLALGIHSGELQSGTRYATSFQVQELAAEAHVFPGRLLIPPIDDSDAIFYVDYEAPAFPNPFQLPPPRRGKLFTPFPTLTEAFTQIAGVVPGTPTLISVVTGSYPEGIKENKKIEVILRGNSTLVLPVGSVAIWGKAGAPPE